MAHQHNKECEDLRAARDALKAQIKPPSNVTSPIAGTLAHASDVSPQPATSPPDVEAELATVEQALREAGCDG